MRKPLPWMKSHVSRMSATHSVRLMVAVLFGSILTQAAEPTVAELSFSRRYETAAGLATITRPAWITGVTQQGGSFVDEPASWQVAATAADGAGKLSISVDRSQINADLAATVLFSAEQASDIAVQLFDAHGRVVVVDLFGNLIDVGEVLSTNTFIIPLAKYPTATKIVFRQVHGAVTVFGVVLYPVASEGPMVGDEVKKLARQLGDPLSPENPILKNLQNIANNARSPLSSTPAAKGAPASKKTIVLQDPPVIKAVKPFAKPVTILVEDSHGGSDIKNEYNFGSAQLGRILAAQGAKVMSTRDIPGFDSKQGLTPALLQPFNIVIFNGRYNPGRNGFTESEIQAVADWVRAGGGLMVTCASPAYGDHQNAAFFNPLIKPYGLQFGDRNISARYTPVDAAAPAVLGSATQFFVPHGTNVIDSAPATGAVVLRNETVLKAQQVGKGRVIAFGAGSAIQNQTLNSRIIRGNPEASTAFNANLAMNLSLWLAGN